MIRLTGELHCTMIDRITSMQLYMKVTSHHIITGIMNITPGSKISIIRSKRVILANTISSCDIIISDGKISSVLPWGKHDVASGAKVKQL